MEVPEARGNGTTWMMDRCPRMKVIQLSEKTGATGIARAVITSNVPWNNVTGYLSTLLSAIEFHSSQRKNLKSLATNFL